MDHHISTTARRRFDFLDQLRGLLLLSMILYHFFWDLTWIFLAPLSWFGGWQTDLWQQLTVSLFILLSGFCWKLGKNPFHRGLQVLAMGIVPFLGTLLFLPSSPIYFGILVFLGSAMILMIPIEKTLVNVPPRTGLFLSILLFFCFRTISQGSLDWIIWRIPLPEGLYQNYFTAYLGLPPATFSSADYFPLLPWFFLFLAGYFLYRLWLLMNRPVFSFGFDSTKIRWLGRHSLLVYLLHQPFLYSLFWGFKQLSFFFERS